MRTQPLATKPQTEPGMLVPWMAYSPPASVMAPTSMGFRGVPPGITFGVNGLSRLTAAGGDQAGFRYLPSMCEVPAHCLPALPTPTYSTWAGMITVT
jgi:hypothetical protein